MTMDGVVGSVFTEGLVGAAVVVGGTAVWVGAAVVVGAGGFVGGAGVVGCEETRCIDTIQFMSPPKSQVSLSSSRPL